MSNSKAVQVPASSRGGLAVARKYGVAWMREIGSRGGQVVAERYGSEFYSNIGSLGADAIHGNMSKTRRMLTKRAVRRIVNGI